MERPLCKEKEAPFWMKQPHARCRASQAEHRVDFTPLPHLSRCESWASSGIAALPFIHCQRLTFYSTESAHFFRQKVGSSCPDNEILTIFSSWNNLLFSRVRGVLKKAIISQSMDMTFVIVYSVGRRILLCQSPFFRQLSSARAHDFGIFLWYF